MDGLPAATVEWNQVQAALEACVDEELLERIILRVLSQHPKVCKNVARALIDGIEEKPHHGADGTDHSERRTQVHLATGESDISTESYVHNASEEAPHSAGGTDCIESGTHVHFATGEGDTSAKAYSQDADERAQRSAIVSDFERLLPPRSKPWSLTHGRFYPPMFKFDVIEELKAVWHPEPGDVFFVSHFPVRGIQRLLVSLVEGADNPWAPGVIDKPHYVDLAVSRRGVNKFLEEVGSWKRRRCFKTHLSPNMFPCQYPFKTHTGGGIAPKIVVLVADPRHAFTIWWQVMPQLGFRADLDIKEFIEAIMDKEISPFGNYFEHAAAWAREAEAYPDMVRLVVADRLGSLDPKEVKASLEEIAEFLEIPTQAAARLAASTFDRPAFADEALQQDTLVIHEALSGGHLVEQSARNLHVFEEALAMASPLVHKIWRQNVASWFECKSGCLKQIAESTIAGVASTPPLALTFPMKGPAAHASGTCRPCVFATRGICKETAAMCRYCHSEEHLPPKRASRKVRKMRKELQGRSARALSPDQFD